MSDDYFDLIVWYAADESAHGFQLCYDKLRNERAVTWIRDEGIRHDRVDSGESRPIENSTPILFPGGSVFGGRCGPRILEKERTTFTRDSAPCVIEACGVS